MKIKTKNEIMEQQIIYTQSAKERLQYLHVKLDEDIKNHIQKMKFVPGDDFIEITASDIDFVGKKIKINGSNAQSYYYRQLITYLYLLAGISFVTGGIYYEEIKLILIGDPNRLILVAVGFVMILISITYMVLLRNKMHEDNRSDSIRVREQRFMEEIEALEDLEIKLKEGILFPIKKGN